MFRLLEESGFSRVRSAVVPGFRFRKGSNAGCGGGLRSEGGDDDRTQAHGRLTACAIHALSVPWPKGVARGSACSVNEASKLRHLSE